MVNFQPTGELTDPIRRPSADKHGGSNGTGSRPQLADDYTPNTLMADARFSW